MVKLHSICEGEEPGCGSAVFFHGLGGDAFKTWQARVDGGQDAFFWPRHLHHDIKGLSVYSVSYPAPLTEWGCRSSHFICQAWEILDCLLAKPELRSGPLYLIGHSLGGLVIKHLIRTAEGDAFSRADAKLFLERLEKVVFLATPHLGANLASLADLLEFLVRQSPAADGLDRGNPHLLDLYRWYRSWANSQHIAHLTLYETRPWKQFGIIVDSESANPGLANGACIPVACDHVAIAKPDNAGSEVYLRVRDFLKRPAKSLTTRVNMKTPAAGMQPALAAA
ncbi:MAG: putative lipase [Beijerinckiaceae bacterium]|nr:putative lipase [Beijerinckiaceae bacterium]